MRTTIKTIVVPVLVLSVLASTHVGIAPAQAVPPVSCSWQAVEAPSPGDDTLFGVAVISPHDIWAVGYTQTSPVQSRPLIEHLDGSIWTDVPQPLGYESGTNLFSVDGKEADDVWAVGTRLGQTLAMHWDGSAWAVIPTPNISSGLNQLFDVEVIASDDVWAVGTGRIDGGAQALTVHWDGAIWSNVAMPRASGYSVLNGIGSTGGSDVWAVGFSVSGPSSWSALVQRWDGSAWTVVPAPVLAGYNQLYEVDFAGNADAWATGWEGSGSSVRAQVEHWDGSSWTLSTSLSVREVNVLRGVTVISTDDVWAAGYSYYLSAPNERSLVAHWDGQSWQTVSAAETGSPADLLYDVEAVSSDEIWAVGAKSGMGYVDASIQHCVRLDSDGDDVLDALDNCPSTPNADQSDLDSDGIGDACDPDIDGDGVPDATDNCPLTHDPSQSDADGDRMGDACDPDADGDGVPNATDVCPLAPGPPDNAGCVSGPPIAVGGIVGLLPADAEPPRAAVGEAPDRVSMAATAVVVGTLAGAALWIRRRLR